jgi:hypothetical protein
MFVIVCLIYKVFVENKDISLGTVAVIFNIYQIIYQCVVI